MDESCSGHWLTGLVPTTRKALIERGAAREYPPDSVLISENAEPTSVMLIESGLVVVNRCGQDEDGIFVAFRRRGELIGEIGVLRGQPRAAQVIAGPRRPVRVLWYPAERFREILATHPDARAAIEKATLDKFLVHQKRGTRYRRGRTVQRVAQVLLDHRADFGRPVGDGATEIDAPLRQDRIADLVGVGTDAVGRAVRTLKTAEAMTLTEGRNAVITIVDEAELTRIAAGALPRRARPP